MGAFGKIKILSWVSHCSSSGASLWSVNWASKLLEAIGIPHIWCHAKKRYKLPGNVLGLQWPWVAWWLEHRTPDRKAWFRCPMPPNTLRVYTEYVLVKSVGPEVLWAESRVPETGEYFPPLQSHGKVVEVGIGGVIIYRPFGESRRANSYCPLYGVQGLGQRQAYF
ncbi:uncharacterized protein TNCV_3290711 [Trichonephila clavipes]|nr:uncharacterized protein TNCV_3290711 [Trichonephila clavipes]